MGEREEESRDQDLRKGLEWEGKGRKRKKAKGAKEGIGNRRRKEVGGRGE